MRALASLLAMFAVGACDEDSVSEIDVAVSEATQGLSRQVDGLTLSVSALRADGERVVLTEQRSASYDGEHLRGWTVRVRPELPGDPGQVLYRFRAEASIDDAPYVAAQARLVFVEGRRLVLPLRLDDSCVAVAGCGGDETCRAGGCVSDFVPACDLVTGGRPASCTDTPDGALPPSLDAGSDTSPADPDLGLDLGLDLGAADTGAPDATADAPSLDGGPLDSGPEASSPDASSPDASSPDACVAIPDCVAGGFDCGEPPDGCGATLACGDCTGRGETCGGGGTPFRCGRATTPDTTPPTVAITSAPEQTNARAYEVAFTGSDTGGSELARFECSVDGGAFERCESPLAFTDQPEGSHALAVRAIDGAGNVSAPASAGWCVDRTAPAIVVRSRPPMYGRSTSTRVVIEVTDGPSCSSWFSECGFDFAAPRDCPGTHDVSGLGDGTHRFTAVVHDRAGNSTTELVDFVVDTRPPLLDIAPIVSLVSTGYADTLSVPFAFSCTDPGSGCDTTSHGCTVDGATTDVTCAWGSGDARVGVASSHDFGTRRLRISVRDLAGNTFAAERDFTVARCAGDLQFPEQTSNGFARGPCCAGLVVSDWVDPIGNWPARADASCRPMSDFQARLFETVWGTIGCLPPLRTTTDWGVSCDTDAGRATCLDSAAASRSWCGDDPPPASCPTSPCPTPWHGLAREGWHGPVLMGCSSGVMALDELALRGGFYGGCFTTVGEGGDRWSVSATQTCKAPAVRYCRSNAPHAEVACVCATSDPYADDGHG